MILYLGGKYPVMWLLDCRVFPFLKVLRNVHTLFHGGCASVHSHQHTSVLFLHILTNACCILLVVSWVFFFFILAILTGVKWYLIVIWFAFPWWWVMLNTFACVCWPSGCLCLRSDTATLATISLCVSISSL